MKTGSSFNVAGEEIGNEKYLFLIFGIIVTLLFSVSVAVMDAAVYLPEHISGVVHENMLDRFFVTGYTYPDDIKAVLEEKNIGFRVESCDAPFPVETVSGNVYGGVMFRDYLNDNDRSFIKEQFNDDAAKRDFFENSCVMISDEMAEKNGLSTGESIDMIYRSRNIKKAVRAEISCIYRSEPSREECYISEGALRAFFEEFPDYSCNYEISPESLREIFGMRSCLEKNGYVIYSKETLRTVRMLYITLYSVNMILLIALAGSVYSFMDIYLQRRKKFYAVQSAIGMSGKDILKILLSISEIIVLIMLVVSAVLSSVILRMINGYADGIFSGPDRVTGIPFLPISADFIIVQFCLAVIMLRFRKRLRNNNIIELLHEK